MNWTLFDDTGAPVEMCAVCDVCGQPNQSSTGRCYYTRTTLWQRIGIWLFDLEDHFVLANRHLEPVA